MEDSAMWSLEARSAWVHAIALCAYLAAVALLVLLQEVGLRLRREEQRAWWAGTGRDLVNAAGFAAIAGALRLGGFPGHAALVLGATLTLAAFGAYVLLSSRLRVRRPRAWALAAGLLMAAPAALWPARVLDLYERLAAALMTAG